MFECVSFSLFQEDQALIDELYQNPTPIDYTDLNSANNTLRTGYSNNGKWVGEVVDKLIPAINAWFVSAGGDQSGSGWKDLKSAAMVAGSNPPVVPVHFIARFADEWHKQVRTTMDACDIVDNRTQLNLLSTFHLFCLFAVSIMSV